MGYFKVVDKIIIVMVLVLLLPLMFKGQTLAAEATIDSTVNTTLNSHKLAPSLVFTSSTTGYMFYRDSGGTCVYSKTTNGGSSWGTAVNITAQTDCVINTVWYDQWTPGLSGTLIHIIFTETSGDDVYYDTLDTNGDTNGTEAILHSNTVNSFTEADNLTITRGTDGDLYAGFCDGSRAANCTVKKCTGTCTTTTNWTAPGTSPIDNANDYIRLVPLASGNVLLVRHDLSANDIQSKVYTDSTNSWATGWTNIDVDATENTTYNETLALTLDRSNNDVYLAYGASVAGSGTADIRTAVYSGGSWTLKTDVVTNQNTTTQLDIFIDELSKDIYVGYLRGTLASSMNAYYKMSVDGMTSWGPETQFNTSNTDLRQVRFNMMSPTLLYGAYEQNAANDAWYGDTVTTISASDPSWDTGTTDFKIYASDTLTWGAGTLACSGTLTDDNSTTINCDNGTDTAPGTQYRVDVILENNGGTTSKLNGSSEYIDHVAVKGGWAGANPTLGGCAFYEPGTADDGTTTCAAAWNNTNDVRITNTGTGNVVIKKMGSEGFMYLVTVDSSLPSLDSSSYMNTLYDSVTEDSSKIAINRIPNPPKDPFANNTTAQSGQASPVYKLTDYTPAFSAVFDDTNTANTSTHYQLQVGTDTDWTTAEMWDSTKISLTTAANARTSDIIYNGLTLLDGTTYYWRMKFWNSRGKESLWTSTLQFGMNAYPSVTSVTLNGGTNIGLLEAATTSVSWTATVTDSDGYSDISTVNGKSYRSGVTGAETCSPDEENCYEDTSCELSSCSGSSCTATCTSLIQFFADPTDSSSPYPTEYWLGFITASDAQSYSDSDFSPGNITDVSSLTALNADVSLSFGSLFVGEDTGSTNETTEITNTGNVAIDTEISGTDMCKDYPSCLGAFIPVGNIEYNLSNFTYNNGIDLTGTDTPVNVSLLKPNSNPSLSKTNLYWGIKIPDVMEAGDFTGENTLTAVPDI